MQPSPYQRNIFQAFDNLEDGGTLQINAVAGAGKTTTLMMLLKQQKQHLLDRSLICAFNKSIATELEARVPMGVTVSTIHALGMKCIAKRYRKPKIEKNKYRFMLDLYWERMVTPSMIDALKADISDVKDSIYDLCHFARVTLTDYKSTTALLEMAWKYGVNTPDSSFTFPIVQFLLDAGKDGLPWLKAIQSPEDYSPRHMIDFDDMIWLPVVENITPERFDLILVDECQDLSNLQLTLIERHRNSTTRMVFVGDPFQAIYAFAGANCNSFENIAITMNAQTMPLSVCFRCPESVITLAQKIVPQILPVQTAERGLVDIIKTSKFEAEVSPKDMILCRLAAPLLEQCFFLLRMGKKARVKGRDIGAQLKKVIIAVEKLKIHEDKNDSPDFDFFVSRLEVWRERSLYAARNRRDFDAFSNSIDDKFNCLLIAYENAIRDGCKTYDDFCDVVVGLFEDDGNGIILLSTIHKSKGLEAERVYILRPEKMPHPMAKTPDAIAQEKNLMYVAITRAQKELLIVETPGEPVPSFWMQPQQAALLEAQ